MPSPLTLPIVAGLSIVGAALGVHLGHSTVGQIDPAYFSDPQVPFHADLTPHRSPDWAQVVSAEYHQPQEVVGLGDGCIGCRGAPVVYAPDYVSDGPASGWPGGTPVEVEAVEWVEPEPDPERERLLRYASYAVSTEEAEAIQAASAASAAAGEEPADTVYADTD